MKKLISLAAVFFFLNVCGYGQSLSEQPPSVPISVCELVKNKQKYIDRPVYIEGTLYINGPRREFNLANECQTAELFFVENNENFYPKERFQLATSHPSLTRDGNQLTGQNYSTYATVLRIKIKVEGIFKVINDKENFPGISPFNALSITDVIEFGQSDLIFASDFYTGNPQIIISKDFN